MNEKKLYIWRLASFLHSQKMIMSGEELAEHLKLKKEAHHVAMAFVKPNGDYAYK